MSNLDTLKQRALDALLDAKAAQRALEQANTRADQAHSSANIASRERLLAEQNRRTADRQRIEANYHLFVQDCYSFYEPNDESDLVEVCEIAIYRATEVDMPFVSTRADGKIEEDTVDDRLLNALGTVFGDDFDNVGIGFDLPNFFVEATRIYLSSDIAKTLTKEQAESLSSYVAEATKTLMICALAEQALY